VGYEAEDGSVDSPEVFPRPDGRPATFAPPLAQADIVAAQACYRPIARDGLPLIGRIAGLDGAYVAIGHSVWGMLNAPATGEAMAELIAEGGARSIDISAFDPARLPALGRDPVRR
jgi:glycine/D-amino acid oxidase-like deaminating enzyme